MIALFFSSVYKAMKSMRAKNARMHKSCALKWLNWVKTVALRARVSTEFLVSPKIPDVFL